MTEKYKCPYCPKEAKTRWQIVNHIKQSSGPHGRKFTFPEGYKIEDIKPTETSEQNVSNVSNVSTGGSIERQETSEQNVSNVQHIEPPKPPEVKMKNCPEFRIGSQSYGPYENNDNIEVPLPVGIFTLCKDIASYIK